MTATYLHIGIPILNKKPGMVYKEDIKLWVSNVDDYDFKIEYLKFEEGTPWPEVLSKRSHVAYRVDDLDYYLDQAQEIVFGPIERPGGVRLAYVLWDDALIELNEKN